MDNTPLEPSSCYDDDENHPLTSIQRLENLLNEKDREIRKLQEEIYEYEQNAEIDPIWWRHEEIKEDHPDLPTPRLELRLKIIDTYKDRHERENGSWEWVYSIVYKHLLGHIVKIPLGTTRSNGCFSYGSPSLPFRDSSHIKHDSESFKLPAYVVRQNEPELLDDVLGKF